MSVGTQQKKPHAGEDMRQPLLPGLWSPLLEDVKVEGRPDVSVGCAKRLVCAIIVKGKRKWVGFNTVEKRTLHCPKSWYGEPFDVCDFTCGKNTHAEINALAQAGRHAKGATMYLLGHTTCCMNCSLAMVDAGIKRVVFNEIPKDMAKA